MAAIDNTLDGDTAVIAMTGGAMDLAVRVLPLIADQTLYTVAMGQTVENYGPMVDIYVNGSAVVLPGWLLRQLMADLPDSVLSYAGV